MFAETTSRAASSFHGGVHALLSPLGLAVLVGGIVVGGIAAWIVHRYTEGPDEIAVLTDATCTHCDHVLTPSEVLPPVWWVRGLRCPSCGSRQPATWWTVQLAVPALGLAMVATWGPSLVLVPFLWLVPVLVIAAAIDVRTMLIPRRVVWTGFFVGLALIVAVSLIEGLTRQIVPALVGAAAYFGFLFLTSVVNPAGMGFGDVRLSVLLGLYLGWINMILPAIGLFIACLFGVLLGLGVRWASHEKRKAFPFGPGLALGTFVAICFYQPLLDSVLRG